MTSTRVLWDHWSMPRPAPTDEELRVSTVYRRLVAAGGGARYAELVRRPHDRAVLSHLVRRGLALKVGHGTYALPAAQPDLVVAARFDAHVDCVSALRLQDVTVLDPRPAPTCSFRVAATTPDGLDASCAG
ncbi:hypothetical protein GCM10025864_29050 [Luteimicrobium album]|uniref:Transcriptional regulator, AbiEi antitoxin, Type IV TA system n=1 Tax=Luteimicrobium album TaxID=1054550 RepID=A0ABQ6I3A0_9MICO|nr:hypothetical protein [Luteimicrobium album]GMA25146.1 hypothetical protein GCM10025864_29050 [Luteimicrobium album]